MSQRELRLFLERRGYRKRRLRDAVRLLPLLGLVLWLIPLVWPQSGISVVSAIAYIFVVWIALALIGAVLSSYLTDNDDPAPPDIMPGLDVTPTAAALRRTEPNAEPRDTDTGPS